MIILRVFSRHLHSKDYDAIRHIDVIPLKRVALVNVHIDVDTTVARANKFTYTLCHLKSRRCITPVDVALASGDYDSHSPVHVGFFLFLQFLP